MLNYQRPYTLANNPPSNNNNNNNISIIENHHHHHHHQEGEEEEEIRDIHALTPPRPPSSSANRGHRRIEAWETSSHRSSSLNSEVASSENFSTMSREFNALVLAGSSISNNHGSNTSENELSHHTHNNNNNNNLGSIGEDEYDDDEPIQETNPLAIVPDNYSNLLDPVTVNPSSSSSSSSRRINHNNNNNSNSNSNYSEVSSVQRVKKEEVETKISAWQTAKISKINNRFKREDAVINGWESEEIQKATSWMKKIERKLEEKRAKALEKMENDIAKARRKAEEKKASAEAKRGTKVAKVIEISNLMRAIGRAPSKRSFF